MSDASDKLAKTRLAIIAHLQGKERRHIRRKNEDYERAADDAHDADDEHAGAQPWSRGEPRRATPAGWIGHLRHVLVTWWRHHPAHMGVELVTPVLSSYAARKPAQYLGIAALVGVLFAIVRPWRLISLTGLLVALVKSSQLSGVLLSAISGIDDGRDRRPPE
jgi:ElaB/YqjD/DUF883 family membrane-anchored ribosome-binding protein